MLPPTRVISAPSLWISRIAHVDDADADLALEEANQAARRHLRPARTVVSIAADLNKAGLANKPALPTDQHMKCVNCHTYDNRGKTELTAPVDELCSQCHARRIESGEHVVGVVQKGETPLPLIDGKVSPCAEQILR